MEGAKKHSRVDYRMGPWRRASAHACVCVMGTTVLRQGAWLIGPCRTHTARIDPLIVCLSCQEDQQRPRLPVALRPLCFSFFHSPRLFAVRCFTPYLLERMGYLCYLAEIIADTGSPLKLRLCTVKECSGFDTTSPIDNIRGLMSITGEND